MNSFPEEINSVSRHFIIHGDDAVKLSNAMECVAENNPSVYYQVFEEAFNQYPVSLDTLKNIAINAGIDQTSLQTCIDENRYQSAVYDMMNQGNTLFGVNGTPGNVIIDRETGKWTLIS
jgi:protein-disulfide isomerase